MTLLCFAFVASACLPPADVSIWWSLVAVETDCTRWHSVGVLASELQVVELSYNSEGTGWEADHLILGGVPMVYNGVKFGVIESLPGCGKKTVHDGGYGSSRLASLRVSLRSSPKPDRYFSQSLFVRGVSHFSADITDRITLSPCRVRLRHFDTDNETSLSNGGTRQLRRPLRIHVFGLKIRTKKLSKNGGCNLPKTRSKCFLRLIFPPTGSPHFTDTTP